MRWQIILILIVAIAVTGGCVRRNGNGESNGGDGDSNIVEGSEVYGEIIPADEDIAIEIDEFAGGGEFSTDTETEVYGEIDTTDGGDSYTVGSTADGFRVQVSAVSYEDNADRIADEVRDRLTGYSVYVDYISDLYKVRVGDCTTRSAAETLRSKLVNLGYDDAWIVKSKVNVD
ncbi:MAG: SPOR domain-containing protein [Candidatus Coatesbacteria bacterium]|nr:MAG: SPOR domain-containing protein [Candidatus Coatesbacteria bacterium]